MALPANDADTVISRLIMLAHQYTWSPERLVAEILTEVAEHDHIDMHELVRVAEVRCQKRMQL